MATREIDRLEEAAGRDDDDGEIDPEVLAVLKYAVKAMEEYTEEELSKINIAMGREAKKSSKA